MEPRSPRFRYGRPISRPYAFVSYSHRNVRWTKSLVASLARAGIPYWFDTKIRPSEVWRDELLEAIDGAACVVVAVTPEAADSEWVQREVAYALDRAKPVIPVTRDETVLEQLAHLQHVTMTSAGRLPRALLTALYDYCGPSTIRVYTNEELGITAAAAPIPAASPPRATGGEVLSSRRSPGFSGLRFDLLRQQQHLKAVLVDADVGNTRPVV